MKRQFLFAMFVFAWVVAINVVLLIQRHSVTADRDDEKRVSLICAQDTLGRLLLSSAPFSVAQKWLEINETKERLERCDWPSIYRSFEAKWDSFALALMANDRLSFEKMVQLVGWPMFSYAITDTVFSHLSTPADWDSAFGLLQAADNAFCFFRDRSWNVITHDSAPSEFLEPIFFQKEKLYWQMAATDNPKYRHGQLSDSVYALVVNTVPHNGMPWEWCNRRRGLEILLSRGYFTDDASLRTLAHYYQPSIPGWDILIDSRRYKGWSFEQRTGYSIKMTDSLESQPTGFVLTVAEHPAGYPFSPAVKRAALNQLYKSGYQPTDSWLRQRVHDYYSMPKSWAVAIAQFRSLNWVERYRNESWDW